MSTKRLNFVIFSECIIPSGDLMTQHYILKWEAVTVIITLTFTDTLHKYLRKYIFVKKTIAIKIINNW